MDSHIITYYVPGLHSTTAAAPPLGAPNGSALPLAAAAAAVEESPEYSLEMKVLTLMGAVGTLGNLLLTNCFLKKRPKHPSDLLIVAFSFCDFGFCLLLSAFNSVRWALNEPNLGRPTQADTPQPHPYLCTSNLFLYSMKPTCSLLILAVMTINRWYAVCSPHNYKSVFSDGNVYKILGLIGLVATVRSVPYSCYCFVYQMAHISPELASWFSQFVMYGLFMGLKMLLVSLDLVLMLVVYSNVAVTLRRASRRRELRQGQGLRLGSTDFTRTEMPNQAGCETVVDCDNFIPAPNGSAAAASSGRGSRAASSGELLPPPERKPKLSLSVASSQLRSVLVRQVTQRGRGAGGGRPSDTAVTLTLFCVCVVFMLLILPDAVLDVLAICVTDFELPDVINKWGNVFYNAYFVINPALYYISNKYFRDYVKQLLSCP